jgi:spore coat-associated protein N
MSRFAFMARHPRRTLGVLALLLAATAVTIGSGANFTASSANPTNTFSAGTLTIGNSSPGTAIFAPGVLMKPGDSRVGIVDIQNTGTITGDFVLGTSNIVNTPAAPGLTSRLTIEVEDCGLWAQPGPPAPTCGTTTIKYAPNTIAGLSGIDMGNFAPGDKRRYRITVLWPNGTPAQDNPLQGAGLTFDLNWTAS